MYVFVFSNMKIVKCVMVGDGAVGKTSGALAFKTGHLPCGIQPTVSL